MTGITEIVLKEYVSNKTNWRKMLSGSVEDVDLTEERDKLFAFVPEEAKPYLIENNKETPISFPVEQYPVKVKSLNLDKTPSYSGVLKGVKGQYLILEDGTVFNVRNW